MDKNTDLVALDNDSDNRKKDSIVKNDTCFSVHSRYSIPCQQRECRLWIEHSKSQNCTIISSQKGAKTLQEIGDIFGLTRMRVCQIEKSVIKKIKAKVDQD